MFTYIPKFNDLSDIEYTDYRNLEEREFLTILYDRVSALEQYKLMEYDDFWMFYHDNILTVAFDIIDENANVVLRSLRIDFTETSLLMGRNETFQYVSALDTNNPDVKKYKKTEYTTIQLAEIAAQWVSQEISRKV